MTFTGNEPQGPTPVATPVPGQEPPAGTQPPGYVTADVLDAKLNELTNKLTQAMSENYRGVQSVTGKFQAQVQQQLAKWEEAAKTAGIQITAEQRKAMETQAQVQTLSQMGGSAQQPGQAAPALAPDANAEMVNNAANALMQVYGIAINEGDPEDSNILVPASNGTPQQYLDAVHEAINAKKARLASGAQPTPQAPPTNPMARTPGMVSGTPSSNPIQNITDPGELWKMANRRG